MVEIPLQVYVDALLHVLLEPMNRMMINDDVVMMTISRVSMFVCRLSSITMKVIIIMDKVDEKGYEP